VDWEAGCTITKPIEDRAARYRNIAAEVRAEADSSSSELARHGMLMAAEVWDRLATLAESLFRPHRKYSPGSRTLNPLGFGQRGCSFAAALACRAVGQREGKPARQVVQAIRQRSVRNATDD
jgi:hypothetical protein